MQWIRTLDRIFILKMRKSGILMLRISLGIVFLWFGALKVFSITPVGDLVSSTYSFLPTQEFLIALGVVEVLIGVGLIANIALRATLGLLWLQMAGVLFSVVLAPSIFFTGGNFLFLTIEGEFIVKNLVLIAAGIVVGGHEVKLSDD